MPNASPADTLLTSFLIWFVVLSTLTVGVLIGLVFLLT